VARDVRRAAGEEARLVRYDGVERFDVLPLLVATDGAIESFGHDGRRLRPNVVIGGVAGLAERGWEGRRLRLGSCLIAARDLRARCVMTTFDPDTLARIRPCCAESSIASAGPSRSTARCCAAGRSRSGIRSS